MQKLETQWWREQGPAGSYFDISDSYSEPIEHPVRRRGEEVATVDGSCRPAGTERQNKQVVVSISSENDRNTNLHAIRNRSTSQCSHFTVLDNEALTAFFQPFKS